MSAERLQLDVAARLGEFRLTAAVDVPLTGCTALVGPSGAGKTSLLRLIAGFEAPHRGHIAVADETLVDVAGRVNVAPHRRAVGFCFQEARLFEHLDVAGNLNFAQRRRSAAPGYSRDDVIDATGLGSLLARQPASLSGGERQRVALARMLLAAPRLALLDEPFSALDRDRRVALGELVLRLPRDFGLPVILVSHDIDEVCRLADTVMTMTEGRLGDIGPAAAILNTSAAALGLDEHGSVLTGTIAAIDERLRLMRIAAAGTTLSLPLAGNKSVGETVAVRLAARDVVIATTAVSSISIRNEIAGTVSAIEARADSPFVIVHLAISGGELTAEITRASCEALDLDVGQRVFALVKSAVLS